MPAARRFSWLSSPGLLPAIGTSAVTVYGPLPSRSMLLMNGPSPMSRTVDAWSTRLGVSGERIGRPVYRAGVTLNVTGSLNSGFGASAVSLRKPIAGLTGHLRARARLPAVERELVEGDDTPVEVALLGPGGAGS